MSLIERFHPSRTTDRFRNATGLAVVGLLMVMLQAATIQTSYADSEMQGWRLIRSPATAGSEAVVAVTHAPDLSSSDLTFAGVMLRCSQNNLQVMLAFIEPFPPRSRPTVTMRGGPDTWQFSTSPIGPGSALVLPSEASELAETKWRSLDSISIQVESEHIKIAGTITLTGLSAALVKLRENCMFE